MRKSQPEPPLESPIPFRTGCNGEYVPRRPTARDRRAEELYRRIVDDRARALGVSRRQFVKSSCGTAAALVVINQVYGCGGDGGGAGDGGFRVDGGATFDADQACEALGGEEFIVDVQTHHADPTGEWRDSGSWELILGSFPQADCGEPDPVDCYDRNHYVREVFVNSDTAVAVLSAVPAVPDENPLVAEEQAETRELVQMLSGSPRLLTHGFVRPDAGQAELDGMERLAGELDIAAWKVYTQFGGWWLDDEQSGIPFIEKARELGIKTICAHKGLTLPGFDAAYASSRDIGAAAAAYSDVDFVVYHSGYETDVAEGPYAPNDPKGVDVFIKALEDNGIGPGGNVYAELGSTWRNVMTSPTEAAHVIGKLLVHVGADNILWGTDSIWYGSPQDQIQAFRTFQIPAELREQYGYPEITPEIRAKIFGLNAAAVYDIDPEATYCAIEDDQLARRRAELVERPAPSLQRIGPQTRREFFAFLRGRGGVPG